MAETINISELAHIVSKDIFEWFRWEKIEFYDENFSCRKQDEHFSKEEKDEKEEESVVEEDKTDSEEKKAVKTHPVDIVFKYRDPYSGKDVLFNTDLKSYASNSIKASDVRDMLKSIAKTIDCASISSEWKNRYAIKSTKYEIRGMLFIYNHDGNYHKNFYDVFKTEKINNRRKLGIDLASIGLKTNQQIHIVEPLMISYMTTIIADVDKLHREGSFPRHKYSFYYPELIRNKTISGDKYSRPATIEAITAPYLIIEHDEVIVESRVEGEYDTSPAGFVIYYNRQGNDPYEFVYLFDTLSRYQILNGDYKIRLRLAHYLPNKDIISHFEKAKEIYIRSWGYDDNKRNILNEINVNEITLKQTCFKTKEVAQRKK